MVMIQCFFNLGIVSLKVITEQALYVTPGSNAPILLNCTYVKENGENIFYIQWRKRNVSDYSALAQFGDNGERFLKNGDYLKNRSDLHSYGNGSTITKILKINDVRCEDEGRYQCCISYDTLDSGRETSSNDTDVFLQGKKI
jgi:hypothetical protein